MYYESLPTYVYELPCGHEFRSLTRSVAVSGSLAGEPETEDTMFAAHWFYCRPCRSFEVIEPRNLVERRPRGRIRAQGDGQLARKIDGAIQADRVAAYYHTVWHAQTETEVSIATGVERDIVKRVALDLGVYEHAERR